MAGDIWRLGRNLNSVIAMVNTWVDRLLSATKAGIVIIPSNVNRITSPHLNGSWEILSMGRSRRKLGKIQKSVELVKRVSGG